MGYTGEQKRAYQREYLAKRRQEWIEAQGGVCALCGSNYRIEIDHIDPTTKSAPVGGMWSRKAEDRERELEKCQLLCYDCHKQKTVAENLSAHGTAACYKRGCKCAPCTAANRDKMRAYRAAKG